MEYTEEQVSEAMEGLPALWVLKHKIRNEAGISIDFKKRKYLWDIYNDLSAKQVLLKPPQIGATVMSMLKCLWVAHKLHKDIIYTLPTATDVTDIVGGATNRIIAQNEILRSWVRDHDTVEQKAVGNNLIRFRGTFSPKQATMVPSSLNVHDEVDNSDQTVLTLYQTRQEAQEKEEDKWQWYFSHPSLEGYGVDIEWVQSDQKEWYIRCNECQAEQVLTWPNSISIERMAYVCTSCGSTLSDNERIQGVWKNKDGVEWTGTIVGDYKFSGFHVSQLMLFNKTAEAIIESYNDPMKDRQYFYNYVLGLPYASSEDQISAETVLKNVSSDINSQNDRVVIGVDTGLPVHYVLMNQEGIFHYNKCKPPSADYSPYKELEGFLLHWPRSILVADQGGDLIGIRELQAKYPGRVFLCYYQKDRKTQKMIRWGEMADYGVVKVDRNRMIQLMVEQFRDSGRIKLNGSREEWKEFASHFANMYRTKEEGPFGVEYTWERKGPDHFAHACLYSMVGYDRFASAPAMITTPDFLSEFKTGRIFE